MMELNPVVYFPIFKLWIVPALEEEADIGKIDLTPLNIVFHLRNSGYHKDYYRYVCMNAWEACGNESKCTSPCFAALASLDSTRKYIPEKTVDWMKNFVEMMQIGAQWGRRYYK